MREAYISLYIPAVVCVCASFWYGSFRIIVLSIMNSIILSVIQFAIYITEFMEYIIAYSGTNIFF